ncbi:capsule assembly Wzi family protein [Thalassotalea sp. ND16A]|uniref:capsule assembly Wzi family protein n=1 Tax=Thalassotalea sp. ND16A TaxID=1535422 RepID=UPI00051A0B29|nr:capsule assembly Wzi family protein [Thalassotalea sp. ND16A]KGJ90206.1 hypothetical protein ND16A_2056 [Thalassotalea sp. ND16A]
MFFKITTKFFVATFSGTLFYILPFFVEAEPWVDTSNVFLRADIQLLADKGHINIPLTTFPLMWADVGSALTKVNEHELDKESKSAYWHVKQKFNFSKRNNKIIEMNFASDEKRFTGFGDEYRDANFIQGHFSYMGDSWAVKLSPSISEDLRRTENGRLDESYAAYFLGNWVISIGMQDRWFGPGWDTNLALTNNARPMPAIALTRKSSTPFTLPFFNDVKIPWTVTTFMGQFEEERHVHNAWLWGFRFNFKPSQNLELGVTRLIQWNGDGRPGGLDTFWDALTGKDNCAEDLGGCSLEDRFKYEPGNQQVAVDARYTLNYFSRPASLYVQMLAEDGNNKNNDLVAQKVWQYGFDTTLNIADTFFRVYLEYTDSFSDCTPARAGDVPGVGLGNCIYEHEVYLTGMRYNGRNLGSSYDNDAESVVFGMVSQLNGLESWELKAKYLDLNNDNADKYPDDPNNGNTVTHIAEEMLVLSLKYQLHQGKFKYTLGGSINHSRFENDDEDDNTQPTLFFNLQYSL